MGEPIEPTIQDVITPEEIDYLRRFQIAYAALAKQTGAELLDSLGAETETRNRLIGSLGLQLESLDFERRRQVAIRFREISLLLAGQTPSMTESLLPDRPAAVAGVDDVSMNGSEKVSPPLEKHHEAQVIPIETVPILDNRESVERCEIKLTKEQKKWFSRLYDEPSLETIERMSSKERAELVHKISVHYRSLKITRIGRTGQNQRAAQLEAFMAGRTNKEIAEEYGTAHSAIWIGLAKMADSITKRTSQDVLDGFIGIVDFEAGESEQTTAEDDDHPAEQAKEPPVERGASSLYAEEKQEQGSLTGEQRTWLARLYDKESLNDIESLSSEQRDELVSDLCLHYQQLKITRLSPEDKKRRSAQLAEFMRGKSIKDIATQFGSSKEALRLGLAKMAESIEKRTDSSVLVGLIESVKSADPPYEEELTITSFPDAHKPVDLAVSPSEVAYDERQATEQAPPQAENQTIEEKPELSGFQKTWYRHLYEDEQVLDAIVEFSPEQLEEFGEMLARYLRSYGLPYYGPEGTNLRVVQMKAMIKGRSIEEIAELTGEDPEKVRKNLRSARERIHRPELKNDLWRIILNIKNNQ